MPTDDANVVNTIAVDDASLQHSEEIYITGCINCHGEEGKGDGLTAARLNPKPSGFRAEHVMELSDGELFYIIKYGIEGTVMEPREFLDEERWYLVNYFRRLQE